MSPFRRVIAAPAAAVLLCALTACGGSTSGSDASPTASASATAEESPTPEPESTTLTAENFIRTIVDAQVAAASYDFVMEMTSQGQVAGMDGSVHLGGDAPSLSLNMNMPEMPGMSIRSSGGMTYVSLGELTGGKFIEVDPDDTSNPLSAGFADAMKEVDPTMGLAGQEAAIVSVTPVGEPEVVDGVELQTYEVVVDPSKMPEEMAALEADLPPGTEVPATLSYAYQVGDDGLVRKVTFDIMGIQSTMSFTNWGSAAPVQAPTAEEISTENPFAG